MRFNASRRAIKLVTTSLLASALILSGCSAPDAGKASASATRTIEHSRGKIQVPEAPKRIIALEPVEIDTVFALGVKPVGVAVLSSAAGIAKYLGGDGVKAIGTHTEPDLEAIAALKPDLILGTETRHAKLYDKLNSIAPTVFMKSHMEPWRESALLVGDALNRRADVQNLIDGFAKRCEQIKQKYNPTDKTAVMIRPRNETTLSLYGPTTMAGTALNCVGFKTLDKDWSKEQIALSPENILQGKADYVFVTSNKPEDASTLPAAFTANKADFPKLKLVDVSYWVFGVGLKGGNKVLDDIEQFLETHK